MISSRCFAKEIFIIFGDNGKEYHKHIKMHNNGWNEGNLNNQVFACDQLFDNKKGSFLWYLNTNNHNNTSMINS